MSYDIKAGVVRCDTCGRFMKFKESGSSWLFVPDSEVSYEELIDRCAVCTSKIGKPMPSQYVVERLCCGIVQENTTP